MYCDICARPVLAGSKCPQTGVQHKPIPMVKALLKRTQQPPEHTADSNNAAASAAGGSDKLLAK